MIFGHNYLFFDPNYDFWPKLRFLTKIKIFDQITIFKQNYDVWPKFRFLTKRFLRFLNKTMFDQNFVGQHFVCKLFWKIFGLEVGVIVLVTGCFILVGLLTKNCSCRKKIIEEYYHWDSDNLPDYNHSCKKEILSVRVFPDRFGPKWFWLKISIILIFEVSMFWRNFRFWATILIFVENFCSKFRILAIIFISTQDFYVWQKFVFLANILIFVESFCFFCRKF